MNIGGLKAVLVVEYCHCFQSNNFCYNFARLSRCSPVASRKWRTNEKSGSWPVFLSKTTSVWKFKTRLFGTWFPACPFGPVPHYATGRHSGHPWKPHMFQATCASRLTHHHSNLCGARAQGGTWWTESQRMSSPASPRSPKKSIQHKHVYSAPQEKNAMMYPPINENPLYFSMQYINSRRRWSLT